MGLVTRGWRGRHQTDTVLILIHQRYAQLLHIISAKQNKISQLDSLLLLEVYVHVHGF